MAPVVAVEAEAAPVVVAAVLALVVRAPVLVARVPALAASALVLAARVRAVSESAAPPRPG
jgi:hypothetical protein